jgi:CelD/BcsL family acetyltransferase involved in cellulose biosynthesis
MDDLEGLEADWRRLEAKGHGSFFQSWGWIGCWSELLPAELRPHVLRIGRDGDAGGLGLTVGNTVTRHRLLRSRGWFLHETGSPEFDCLTMEHNGLLAQDGQLEGVVAQAVDFLSRDRDWDELIIGGVDLTAADYYRRAAEQAGLGVREVDRKPWFTVDLGRVREARGDYLGLLSGNSRYQIRRSMRDYEEAGPLAYTVARTIAEAHHCFDRLGELHQHYWRSRGRPGAFAHEFFRRFHRRLIEREFANGAIQLARISAGSEDIGYLYNFVQDGRVYAYQSGFAYGEDGKRKPGLVCHALAVSHAASQGFESYDLLAGDSQYKRSLATGRDEMVWLSLRRARVKFWLEDLARRLRDAWVRARAASRLDSGETGAGR